MLELLLLGGLLAGTFAGNRELRDINDRLQYGDAEGDGGATATAYLLLFALWPIAAMFAAPRMRRPYLWLAGVAGAGFFTIYEIINHDAWGWYGLTGVSICVFIAALNLRSPQKV